MTMVMREHIVNTSEKAPNDDYLVLWKKQERVRERERVRQSRSLIEQYKNADRNEKEKIEQQSLAIVQESKEAKREHRLSAEHEKNKTVRTNTRLLRYSLLPGEFEAMQEWKPGCHNCGQMDTDRSRLKWNIDHDHNCCPHGRSCGKCVRGLLCSKCNINEISGIDLAVASGRLAPDCHSYLRDNWTHHREEWMLSNA